MKKRNRKNHQPETDSDQKQSGLPDAPEWFDEPDSAEAPKSLLEDMEKFRSMAQRAQADLVNYRKRIEDERAVFAQNANNNLIMKFLPIIDDFELAISHAPTGIDSSWSTGIEMILKKFQATIDASGAVSFSPWPGAEFDPSEHESAFFENSSEVPAGTIVRTIRLGYRVGERVMRPAQVVIAQQTEGSAGTEEP